MDLSSKLIPRREDPFLEGLHGSDKQTGSHKHRSTFVKNGTEV